MYFAASPTTKVSIRVDFFKNFTALINQHPIEIYYHEDYNIDFYDIYSYDYETRVGGDGLVTDTVHWFGVCTILCLL